MITEINNEVKSEIIKAHIYGHSIEEIETVMQISASVIKEALNDTKAVEEKPRFPYQGTRRNRHPSGG